MNELREADVSVHEINQPMQCRSCYSYPRRINQPSVRTSMTPLNALLPQAQSSNQRSPTITPCSSTNSINNQPTNDCKNKTRFFFLKFGAFGGETEFSEEALAFLLKGGRRGDGGGSGDDQPPADWLSDTAWRMILALSSLEG